MVLRSSVHSQAVFGSIVMGAKLIYLRSRLVLVPFCHRDFDDFVRKNTFLKDSNSQLWTHVTALGGEADCLSPSQGGGFMAVTSWTRCRRMPVTCPVESPQPFRSETRMGFQPRISLTASKACFFFVPVDSRWSFVRGVRQRRISRTWI